MIIVTIHVKCIPCQIYLKLLKNEGSVVVSMYICKLTMGKNDELTSIDSDCAMPPGHSNKKMQGPGRFSLIA